MIARLRAFCREESLGIVIPAGVVILFALWQLLEALSDMVMLSLLRESFADGERFAPLDFELAGIQFDWTFVARELPAFLALCAITYYLVAAPIPGDEIIEEEMRTCPECFSEIVVEARRCAFCTAVVEPLAADGESEY